MRRELVVAIGAASVVAGGAWLLGSAQRTAPVDRDLRPSTLLNGPDGARGTALLLEATGTRVRRLRRAVPPDTVFEAGTAFAVIGAPVRIAGAPAERLAALSERVALVLVGGTLRETMRCFGWTVTSLAGDSVQAVGTQAEPSRRPLPWIGAVLDEQRTGQAILRGSSFDAADATCEVPTPARVDTLVRATDGRAVAVRLHYADRPSVTLASVVTLVRNRTVRTTAAAGMVVQLLGAAPELLVDEMIHGFADGRPIWRVVADWVLARGAGIAVVHLVLVGIILLVVRGGPRVPPRPLPLPPRRSSAEHVQALASALAVAGGRVEAVRLLVRGLRRRFGDRHLHEDDGAWLASARQAARTPAARAALDRLAAAVAAPTDSDVLAAAQAADDFRHETLP